MIKQHEFENYLNSFPDVVLELPFGDKVRAFSVRPSEGSDGKLFAIVEDGSKPLQVSLRCDPQLATTLRERYETVLPGKNLNKKYWITVICTGQLDDDEIEDLARHSYIIASQQ